MYQSYSIGFARASYRAVSTLAFVAPEVVLPRIVEQLHADINADEINSLTDQDLGIWATPEGTAYVDGKCFKQARVGTRSDIS